MELFRLTIANPDVDPVDVTAVKLLGKSDKTDPGNQMRTTNISDFNLSIYDHKKYSFYSMSNDKNKSSKSISIIPVNKGKLITIFAKFIEVNHVSLLYR